MRAKQGIMNEDYDFIRCALMREPRGYNEMTGAILTSPVTNEADFGLLFIDNSEYLDLCSHATVGAATAAFELGWVKSNKQKITFDTIAGPVSVLVKYKDGKVFEATMRNVPSYSLGKVTINLEGKSLSADIAYSGNIFSIVNASNFDIPATSKNVREWVELGLKIRNQINQSENFQNLTSGRSINVVEFSAPPTIQSANFKSIVIFGEGQVDREPCGTGTCAKMACLFRKGDLQVGDRFVQESIIGTLASARAVAITDFEGHKAIIVDVTYSAFITGLHQFLIDEDDPMKEGYFIG